MNAPDPVSGRNPAPSQPNLVPAAARKHVDEANRLIAELNAPPTAARAEWQPGSPQAPPQPPGVPDPQAPPPAAVAAAAAAPAAPQVALEEQIRRSEARYASLQGKYNAEITALRTMQDQTNQLVSQLLERPAATAPVPAVELTPAQYLKSLGATDKDIEDYGDLLPIVIKLAQNMVRPTLDKLNGELQNIKVAAGTTSRELVRTRQSDIERSLDATVPNWRVINEDSQFLDWLEVLDIFSGTSRRNALVSAYNSLDAARVTAIFQAYVGEDPSRGLASTGPMVDAETLVAPQVRGGPAGAPEGQGAKRIWSESEIGDFYTRVRRRLVSPEEYKRISAEIAVAAANGRVRPTRPDFHTNAN